MDAFWIILTASLVAASTAILGSFLVLRQMTMVADAISHAVLPGIALAFIATQSRDTTVMLLGASVVGLFATWLIETLHRKGRLPQDASIGIAFTGLFAIGVILISAFAGKVDLDQDCVLYGEIAYAPLDVWISPSGLNLGPKPVWLLGGLLITLLIFLNFAYKPLTLTSFDPNYAAAIGFSTMTWHYLLMGGVSLTTVLSFESVGAILVVAFFVVPAAAARLLTDSLKGMILRAVALGVAASVAGYFLAVWVNGSIAGAISVVLGLEFAVVLVWSQWKNKKRTQVA